MTGIYALIAWLAPSAILLAIVIYWYDKRTPTSEFAVRRGDRKAE